MTKEFAPSAERNKDEVLQALLEVLPNQGTILEVASGPGQHAVHFAPHFPKAHWQPSDRRPEALESQRAYIAEAGLDNVLEPVRIDLIDAEWPVERADAMVGINFLHISPWTTCEGFFAGAARTLAPGAPLFYYGALLFDDRENAPSNHAFDRNLRERDPSWGVRNYAEVLACAETHGLRLDRLMELPNNNFGLVLRMP